MHARSLKLKSSTEWRQWCKSDARPPNIATNPRRAYAHDGWQGYGYWPGTGTVAPKDQQFLRFTKAFVVRTLNSDARPANMPSTPDRTYTHEAWQGYRLWLGTS